VYFICTSLEEINGGAAAYAAQSLPGEILLAVDVAPAAPEYEIPLDATPVILVSDQQSVYSRSVCQTLAAAGEAAGTGSRYAAVEHYGSDASCVRKTGSAAQIGCLGVPTDNTHGFEVCVREGLTNCAKLLTAYLRAAGAVPASA
jgi:putative aminopeptidase FrvX